MVRAHPNLRETRLERMSSDDPRRPDPPAAADDGKVIEMGGAPPPERRRNNRPFRWRLVVGIAVLVTGGGIAYVIGDRHSPDDAARPSVARSEASAVSAVTSTGVTCSMQQGTALSIGVQLVNHAGHAVNLDEMIVELPPGSRFDLVAGFWGPCGTSNRSAPATGSHARGQRDYMGLGDGGDTSTLRDPRPGRVCHRLRRRAQVARSVHCPRRRALHRMR